MRGEVGEGGRGDGGEVRGSTPQRRREEKRTKAKLEATP